MTSGWPGPDGPATSIFVAEQAARLREAGVEVNVLAFSGRMNPLNYLRARHEARRLLGEGGYDVLHVHFGQAGLVAFPAPVPVVVTLYGSDVLGVFARSGRYTLRGRVLARISRWVSRRADLVILVARNLAAGLGSDVTFEVLPIGVDRRIFKPEPKEAARAALGWEQEGVFVVFAGRPDVPAKRYDLAQEVVRRLPSTTKPQLVSVVGQPRAGVAKYLNAADALLMTSRHEGSPAIVREAVACNLPVVSVDVGDVREVIGSIPGCVVCDEDDASTIGRALASVLHQRKRIEGQEVAARLDQRSLALRQIDIYGRVVSRQTA